MLKSKGTRFREESLWLQKLLCLLGAAWTSVLGVIPGCSAEQRAQTRPEQLHRACTLAENGTVAACFSLLLSHFL